MYLNDLTQTEIEIFIKKYVKNMHVALKDCYEDCKVDVAKMERTNSSIMLTTVLSDETGYLEEKWLLTPYKGIQNNTNSRMSEIKNLTKDWSRYIYKTLKIKNTAKAEEYRKSFLDYIKFEREQKIIGAKETYNELAF